MRPRADEVLKSILWTFDEVILPDPTSTLAQSQCLTVSNLLRHVLLRMEREGLALFEDNRELAGVLGDIAVFAAEAPLREPALDRTRDQIVAVLDRPAPQGYVGLNELTAEAERLREVLTTAIQALHAVRPHFAGSADYLAIRQKIRAYLDNQLAREAPWIDEAFIRARR